MYIVIGRKLTGQLKAAPTPFEHNSLQAAKIEACRLSKKYPGNTFYPVKLLKGYTEARPNPILSPKGGVEYANVYD